MNRMCLQKSGDATAVHATITGILKDLRSSFHLQNAKVISQVDSRKSLTGSQQAANDPVSGYDVIWCLENLGK